MQVKQLLNNQKAFAQISIDPLAKAFFYASRE